MCDKFLVLPCNVVDLFDWIGAHLVRVSLVFEDCGGPPYYIIKLFPICFGNLHNASIPMSGNRLVYEILNGNVHFFLIIKMMFFLGRLVIVFTAVNFIYVAEGIITVDRLR